MEILKWFSGNTEMKVEILNHGHVCTNMQIWSRWFHKIWLLWLWLYWSKWCFLPVQLDCNIFFTSAYLRITYHCMSKSIPFWKMFFCPESFLRALLCWCVCWWRPQEIETQSIIYSFYSASSLLTNTRPSKMEVSP